MQFISKLFLQAIEWALSLLPNSPFLIIDTIPVDNQIYQYIRYINWFVDVSACVSLLSAWCACIIVYYIYQIVLRWAKAIS